MRKTLFFGLGGLTLIALVFFFPLSVRAAVSNWQQGINITPNYPEELGHDHVKQSLRDLAATGASHVSFTIPYYQNNITDNFIGPGWNTPTDEALSEAISYAKSLGLEVTLRVHAESYSGHWRAHISPSNRAEWFGHYGNLLKNLARLAEEQSVDLISIGTELVSLSTPQFHSENTGHWYALIDRVRRVYSGDLTYSANSTNNNDNPFENEKKFIEFWPALDYAGLSAYYGLNTGDNSVAALAGAWDYWNDSDLRPFQQSIGKPLLFAEVGYRSVSGAHWEPWNWARGGNFDEWEQANAYDALLTYWNDYPYLAGVYFWGWDPDPNAGGQGNTNYTPQNKQAEEVLRRWWSGAGEPPDDPDDPEPPPPPGEISLAASASASPANPNIGAATQIQANLQNNGSALSNAIIDLEIYRVDGGRAHQDFFEGQSLGAGESKNYGTTWTPSETGEYRVTVGVFNGDWSQNYYWNDEAARLAIGAGGGDGSGGDGGGGGDVRGEIDLWWPTDGVSVSGTQPFKAMIPGSNVEDYQMFWQVDGDRLNEMFDSQEDYPHKEAWVEVGTWQWNGSGPYRLNFVAKHHDGTEIARREISISIQ